MSHIIKLNGTQLIAPVQWDESYSVVENVNTTEAGTDQVTLIRDNKLNVAAAFQCSSRWYHKFMELSLERSITLYYYDPHLNGYGERTVRMRDLAASFQQYSEKNVETYGYWSVSFSLIEF